ncbi:MAG: beta-ketoacyl-[acyl-carrier-protein] synthase II [Candidatus Margulisbacteria bacterium]|nr:beta-ketoacyl-[acyl-carrier-protein] synthase II [Candidatus Margulisiibacteriota bacterium]
MLKRVVITGMGAVTPIGTSVPDFWEGLISGRNGVGKIQAFDTSQFSTQIAAEVVGFDFSPFFDAKEVRRSSRFILLAVAAAQEAVRDSGLDISKDPEHVGVEIGSGIGGIEILEQACEVLLNRGPSKMSPFTVPMMICDMAAGQVAMKTGAKGPNSCSVTACASSAHSMSNAFRLIQLGDAVAMITGGSEACITPLGLGAFCAARSLSTANDDPEHASRPFDKTRDGFVMGEGAGILVFEELEHAKARGAQIYAEVVGFGSSGDAYHLTAPAPEGEGAARAIKMALAMAKISPEDVDYVNAHGTSTYLNDKNETAAIKTAFGEHAYKMAVSSTKSMTGHLLGAAGGIELIASALAIKNGIVPPTMNYETIDPECDLNYTPNKAIARDINVAISNSFGFGGHNGVLVLKKFS